MVELFQYINEHFGKVIDFIFWGVIVGYVFKKWVGDQLIKLFKQWSEKTERTKAIWLHYNKQIEGQGHAAESVLDCADDDCKVFRSYA